MDALPLGLVSGLFFLLHILMSVSWLDNIGKLPLFKEQLRHVISIPFLIES